MLEIEQIREWILNGTLKRIKIGDDVWDLVYAGKENEDDKNTMLI